MQAITYATAEAQLADTIERVCVDHEPVIITRDHDQAVVILSLDDYNARPETQRPRDPETQRRRGATEERALLNVPIALLFSFSSSLLLFFSAPLRLCVFARDIFFLCRLRDMAPSDGHYAEAAPGPTVPPPGTGTARAVATWAESKDRCSGLALCLVRHTKMAALAKGKTGD